MKIFRLPGIFLILFLPLLLIFWGGEAEAARIAGISRGEADSLARQTVIYNDLPVTFNTLSRDLLQKVYGRASYRGLSAEQVIASFRLFPLDWKNEPVILIKDEGLRERIGLRGKYASLSSFFDRNGNYLVEQYYKDTSGKELRAVEELDEKVGILLGVISGELIIKDDKVRLPEWKVSLELLYNRVPLLKILFILLFSGTFIAGAGWVYIRFSPEWRWSNFISFGILGASFLISLVNFIIEWILAGRIPLSNMGETLNFTVMTGLGVMLFLALNQAKRKGKNGILNGAGIRVVCFLFWGCVALVSWMIGENPVITPLMPALQSPWLSIHVTLVMISYALLAMTFVISLIGVVGKDRGDELRKGCMMILYPGVIFLIAGIVTGSIWAKDAWGAYWSWDPKETWALITLILYSLPVLIKLRGRWLYIYLLLAFLSVLMTYFGVNYFLGGRHSYV